MRSPLMLLIFVFCVQFFLHAQTLPTGDWNNVDADVLGFVYLSDGEQLIKTNPQGQQVANYQNSYLGDIHQIDCFKGLKNLVFHKDANSVVLLDNQLAPLGDPMDLTAGGFYDVSAVCLGSDDRIWMAEAQTGQLLLVAKSMEVLQKGGLYQKFTNASEILKMVWRNNMLFMVTRANELLVFDQFGTFSRKFSFNEIRSPFINYAHMFFLDRQHVLKFNYTVNETDTLYHSNKPIEAVWQSKNQLYLLKENRIEILNH